MAVTKVRYRAARAAKNWIWNKVQTLDFKHFKSHAMQVGPSPELKNRSKFTELKNLSKCKCRLGKQERWQYQSVIGSL